MIDESYITSLEERIKNLIQLTKNTYERLITNTKLSPYEYKQQEDELTELIIRIMFYKKQLFRIVNSEETLEEFPTREEYAKIRHQRLLNDKAMFEEQISIIDRAIEEIGDNKKLDRLINQLEMEKFRNQTSLGAIMSNLRIYEQKPDLTDEEIDIYLNGNEGDISFRGIIYLHDTSLEVGEIEYRGQVDSKWLGDIGYSIREEYRGHNYAYKALTLISTLITAKRIDKVNITTYKNNLASVKTIEKFGGVLKETTLADVLIYECDLNHILLNSSETHAKNK